MKISKLDIEVKKANIGSRSRRWDFGLIHSERSVEAIGVCRIDVTRKELKKNEK